MAECLNLYCYFFRETVRQFVVDPNDLSILRNQQVKIIKVFPVLLSFEQPIDFQF
ncbi:MULTISPECIES: hypothetical protein [Sphingobacterium]|uniref:hypothetical protein n=1 Tax=Sphingobacterium TaxID=28453 RepID=UPI002579523A|nr:MULTISPECIES: hypothetical protein [Sphingobacterium]